jgi:hypothetical protein
MKLVTNDVMKVSRQNKPSARNAVSSRTATVLSGGTAKIQRRTDRIQEKSTHRTSRGSSQQFANLYRTVEEFIGAVERAWSAAENLRDILEQHDPELAELDEEALLKDLF